MMDSKSEQDMRRNFRHFRNWLVFILIGGGVLAVLVDHMLDRLAKPKATLTTSVTTSVAPIITKSQVNLVTHTILLRNEGDIAFRNLNIRIKFNATSDKATIIGPVKWAIPDSILDFITDEWVHPDDYKVNIVHFAPSSEISFSFDADQLMTTTIDVLGDEVQFTRLYSPD